MKATRPRGRGSHDHAVADRASGHTERATTMKSPVAAASAKSASKSGGHSNGDGKHLNPDATPALAAPGTVEAEHGGQRSDEQLIAAYRGGDRASFNELVGRYQRELFHFLVRFLGDRAAAEDVFQEAFLQVHQSADQFDASRRFRPWLFTIAANKARDLMRSNARRPTNPLSASINSSDDESGEFIDLMSSAAQMPDEPLQ